MGKSRVVLYFGSFNPVHKGHIALAEWIVENDVADQVILVVSPHNPLKDSAELAPEFSRYEMCETACSASKYPDKIKVSAIEFTLDRPSYTINTLRWLDEHFGKEMDFSVLMGMDSLATIDRWRDYDQILDNYHVLVYPRRGYAAEQFLDRVTLLNDAPLFDFSATEVRQAVERGERIDDMVCPQVADYIQKNRLWK